MPETAVETMRSRTGGRRGTDDGVRLLAPAGPGEYQGPSCFVAGTHTSSMPDSVSVRPPN
jgi:hypothetical protein